MTVSTEMARRLRAVAKRIKKDIEERDQLVLEARAAGGNYREIAREVGLSHVAVMNIVTRLGDPLDATPGKKLTESS